MAIAKNSIANEIICPKNRCQYRDWYKTLGIAFFCTTVVSAVNANALDNADGFYTAFTFGKAIPKNIKNSNLPITSTVDIEPPSPNDLGVRYKRGVNAALALGYQQGNLRYELAGAYCLARIKNFTTDRGKTLLPSDILKGSTRLFSATTHIYYDFNQMGGWAVPYLGIGGGIAQVRNKIQLMGSPVTQKAHKTERKPIVQATAGFKINLTEELAALVEYRYSATSKLKALERRFQSHALNLGVRVPL